MQTFWARTTEHLWEAPTKLWEALTKSGNRAVYFRDSPGDRGFDEVCHEFFSRCIPE